MDFFNRFDFTWLLTYFSI